VRVRVVIILAPNRQFKKGKEKNKTNGTKIGSHYSIFE